MDREIIKELEEVYDHFRSREERSNQTYEQNRAAGDRACRLTAIYAQMKMQKTMRYK